MSEAMKGHWLGRGTGGVILGMGWILSPLSWWNDWFVNIPLAWLLASLWTGSTEQSFIGLFVFFYWLSNMLGFFMMYLGWKIYRNERKCSKKELLGSFLVSIAYTLVILMLIKFGVLKPLL